MDWVGGTLVLGAVTCLVLGLQWGGNTKPWSDGAVIATLVLGPVLFLITIAWERYLDERVGRTSPLALQRLTHYPY